MGSADEVVVVVLAPKQKLTDTHVIQGPPNNFFFWKML